jgi:organic radical activating enzyme
MSMQLEKWDSGGILLTYWCNAACADCYENSSPRKKSVMPLEDAREYLKELKLLGCNGPGFHFAGGEPFYNYKYLIDCFKAAKEVGMLPLGELETNAFWCTDDELVRERLTEIRELGLVRLLVSCDVFHQEFVPIQRVQRAVRVGREVLGEKGVRVRFWEFFHDPIDVMKLTEEEKLEVFRDELKQRPERIVGRAAKALSHFVERRPKGKFADSGCEGPILQSRHIHLDPHGNIFPSGCSGLILANAKKRKISEIHEKLEYHDHPVLKMLIERGPVPLLEKAIEHGFEDDEKGYASKCHLCFETRTFLWEQGLYPDEIGPEEIYTD